jgi:hypothetical protein
MTPSITLEQIYIALGNFLQFILPDGVSVVVGQVNRVAEPMGDFVVMWPLRIPRLSTNLDTPDDCKFEGSIAERVLTVTDVEIGVINSGRAVFGAGVQDQTKIVTQLTGDPGGAGTYTVSPIQTVAATTLSAGTIDIQQDTEIVMQIDVHGPNSTDNAQTISTLFRDDFAVDQFDQAAIAIAPLYADDPRQAPFINAASQYEDRWVVEAHMQVNPVISVPQQFSDGVDLTTSNVDTL